MTIAPRHRGSPPKAGSSRCHVARLAAPALAHRASTLRPRPSRSTSRKQAALARGVGGTSGICVARCATRHRGARASRQGRFALATMGAASALSVRWKVRTIVPASGGLEKASLRALASSRMRCATVGNRLPSLDGKARPSRRALTRLPALPFAGVAFAIMDKLPPRSLTAPFRGSERGPLMGGLSPAHPPPSHSR
jgi:hypothetical protein